MHYARVVLLAAGLLIGSAALASERGLMIRAGDLFAPTIQRCPKARAAYPQPVGDHRRASGRLGIGGRRGQARLGALAQPAA